MMSCGDETSPLDDEAEKVISNLQPCARSQQIREEVFNFVAAMVTECFSTEKVQVGMFGSVPIRTYLPHGDIDCTFYKVDQQVSEVELPNWASRLAQHMEASKASRRKESGNCGPARDAYSVQSVQVIPAEVTLVKCNVRVPLFWNSMIVVDISYNQVGGVNAATFLEDMDRQVDAYHLVRQGRAHSAEQLLRHWMQGADPTRPCLLKRSVILVKAWSYYEARILGAHHSLMSSYALEVMVLYILLHYHKACTPLAVLHNFLEVLSQFDWSKFALSLQGPVLLSSIVEGHMSQTSPGYIVKNAHDIDHLADTEPLIPLTVLDLVVGAYPMPAKGEWRQRPMNILDPLQHLNNLGRSISRASHARIVSAMRYVAADMRRLSSDVAKDPKTAEAKFCSILFSHPYALGQPARCELYLSGAPRCRQPTVDGCWPTEHGGSHKHEISASTADQAAVEETSICGADTDDAGANGTKPRLGVPQHMLALTMPAPTQPMLAPVFGDGGANGATIVMTGPGPARHGRSSAVGNAVPAHPAPGNAIAYVAMVQNAPGGGHVDAVRGSNSAAEHGLPEGHWRRSPANTNEASGWPASSSKANGMLHGAARTPHGVAHVSRGHLPTGPQAPPHPRWMNDGLYPAMDTAHGGQSLPRPPGVLPTGPPGQVYVDNGTITAAPPVPPMLSAPVPQNGEPPVRWPFRPPLSSITGSNTCGDSVHCTAPPVPHQAWPGVLPSPVHQLHIAAVPAPAQPRSLPHKQPWPQSQTGSSHGALQERRILLQANLSSLQSTLDQMKAGRLKSGAIPPTTSPTANPKGNDQRAVPASSCVQQSQGMAELRTCAAPDAIGARMLHGTAPPSTRTAYADVRDEGESGSLEGVTQQSSHTYHTAFESENTTPRNGLVASISERSLHSDFSARGEEGFRGVHAVSDASLQRSSYSGAVLPAGSIRSLEGCSAPLVMQHSLNARAPSTEGPPHQGGASSDSYSAPVKANRQEPGHGHTRSNSASSEPVGAKGYALGWNATGLSGALASAQHSRHSSSMLVGQASGSWSNMFHSAHGGSQAVQPPRSVGVPEGGAVKPTSVPLHGGAHKPLQPPTPVRGAHRVAITRPQGPPGVVSSHRRVSRDDLTEKGGSLCAWSGPRPPPPPPPAAPPMVAPATYAKTVSGRAPAAAPSSADGSDTRHATQTPSTEAAAVVVRGRGRVMGGRANSTAGPPAYHGSMCRRQGHAPERSSDDSGPIDVRCGLNEV